MDTKMASAETVTGPLQRVLLLLSSESSGLKKPKIETTP
jgi:hypothetical protein